MSWTKNPKKCYPSLFVWTNDQYKNNCFMGSFTLWNIIFGLIYKSHWLFHCKFRGKWISSKYMVCFRIYTHGLLDTQRETTLFYLPNSDFLVIVERGWGEVVPDKLTIEEVTLLRRREWSPELPAKIKQTLCCILLS